MFLFVLAGSPHATLWATSMKYIYSQNTVFTRSDSVFNPHQEEVQVFLAVVSAQASHLSSLLTAASGLPDNPPPRVSSLLCISAASPLYQGSRRPGWSTFSSRSGITKKASCCEGSGLIASLSVLALPPKNGHHKRRVCLFQDVSCGFIFSVTLAAPWFVLVFPRPGSEVHGSLKVMFGRSNRADGAASAFSLFRGQVYFHFQSPPLFPAHSCLLPCQTSERAVKRWQLKNLQLSGLLLSTFG